jgi:hypothetical protein
MDLTSTKAITTLDEPSATLHSLLIQHRTSLLSIHLAEVLYALSTTNSTKPDSVSVWKGRKDKNNQRSSFETSFAQLRLAAITSERIALELSGMGTLKEGSAQGEPVQESIPATAAITISSRFATEKLLKRPATNLLRDARRSAAEAWNLSGILYEKEGKDEDTEKAMRCFKKALEWSGEIVEPLNDLEKSIAMKDQTLEKEKEMYWKNYTRTRDRVATRAA